VKASGEEVLLEMLAKKWTDAGREVAEEVWGLVKDSGGESASGGGWRDKGAKKRGFEEGWGWDDKDAKKVKTDGFERNWGWNVERTEDRGEAMQADDYRENDRDVELKDFMQVEEEHEDEEKRQDTLGTMLRQLGIAPETFGWNEDEGEFV